MKQIRAPDQRHGLSGNLYNILYNIRRKKGHVQHMYNSKNGQKRHKTEQNKNSGEPHKYGLSRYFFIVSHSGLEPETT